MFKRKIASLVILILILQALSPIYANNIFERKSAPVTLAKGVTQQNIQRYTNQGWININLIRAQLTDAIKFDVLTGPNLTTRTSLSAMLSDMNVNDTAIAAINADYFDLSLNTTLGNVVKDGKILTTSVGFTDTQKLASFNIDYQHLANIAYTQKYSHSMSNGSISHPIDFFNKPLLHSGVTILFDRSFFPVSYGNTLKTVSYIHEMLIVDGVVQDIRINGEPFEIPENGYVIASTGNRLESIKVIYKIGDRIDIQYDPIFSAHQLMMGGGAQLVANGAPLTKFSLESPGRHPRTAVGVSKDRKEVLLVTIDGRAHGFAGVTLSELAQIMVELGAFEAINMDGGGSTQMMARLPYNDAIRTINYPSDGSARNMYTGLVIERVIKDNPTPMSLVFAANQNMGYVGSAKGFKINVFDSNMTPLDVTKLDVKWQAEGLEGTWNGSTFVPQAAGKGKITATYGALKAQIDFEVVQGAVSLVVKPEVLQIAPGESQKLSFWVESEKGTLIPLAPNLIKADFSVPVASFDSGTGTVHVKSSTDPSFITFSFDGLKTHTSLYTTSAQRVIQPFETRVANFSSFPLDVVGSYADGVPGGYVGSGALLTYDFTKHDVTRAVYADFIQPINLPSGTTEIGLWVKGDGGGGNWLRARVRDVQGTSTNLTLALSVDWTGWQYVKTSVPQSLQGPLTLQSIYLVQPDAQKKTAGTLHFDELKVTVMAGSVVVPESITRHKTFEELRLPKANGGAAVSATEFSYATGNALPANAITSSGGFKIEHKETMIIANLDNSKQSLRLSNNAQWPELLKLLDGKPNKPLVLLMSSSASFTDFLEKELLYEKLSSLSVPSVVIYPSTTTSFKTDYVMGIQNVHMPKLAKESATVLVASQDGKLYFEARRYALVGDSVFSLIDLGNHWGKEAVLWGVAQGMVQGYPDGTFKPDQPILEGETLTLLAKYVLQTNKERLAIREGAHWSQVFYNELSQWALPMKGLSDDQLKNAPMTRGEFARLIAAKYGFNLTEEQAIYFMYENDLSQGMQPGVRTFASYGPHLPLTRAQVVTFFRNMDLKTDNTTFLDAPSIKGDATSRDLLGIVDVPLDLNIKVDFSNFQ